jgi:hypothetical protein
MFSQGQLLFGGCFAVAFIIAMIIAYRKDANLHQIFYKGNYKILLAFLLFIGLLFLIKIYLRH